MIIQFFVFTVLILFLILWGKIIYDKIISSNHIIVKIIVCLFLVILFKYDWGTQFLGLEYEDAYSFSAYTRQLSYNIHSHDLRVECVDVGSLHDPILTSTYGGHFITYSLFLYLFTSIFGFSFFTISIINSIISLMSLLTLTFNFNDARKNIWLIVALSYCLAPAINLFSTTFLSETFSSFISICFVLSFFSLNKKSTIYHKVFVLCSFFLAILTKRDNTILIIIPFLVSFIEFINKRYLISVKIILPYILILIFISLFIHNIFLAELEETNDISEQTFSLSIFTHQFPIYIKSLFTFKFFTISIPLFFIALILGFITKNSKKEIICLTCLFIGYILMYSAHYRGYYFIKEIEEFTPFSTFRYLNNFFYIVPITIGFALKNSCNLIKPTYAILCIFCCISLFFTVSLRKELNEEEYLLRFKNIDKISSLLPEDAVIITDVPLLFLNVSSPNIYICNLSQIDNVNFNTSKKYFFIL